MSRALDRLAKQAAEAIGTGPYTDDPGVRAACYRNAAEVFVTAREHFLTAAGEPDWTGKTYDYRTWNGGVWAASGASGDARRQAQAAVRYHVGNVLRERLDAATLEALGLRVESPRERSVEQRAERSALLRSVTGSSSGFRGVDALRALTSAQALVDRADLSGLDAEERRAAKRAVSALLERLDALAEEIGVRRR